MNFFLSFSPFVYGPQYFDMKVGPQNNDRLFFFFRAVVVVYFLPRWEFFFEGGRHGASMDGPLAFAYHQLPLLILHPPRSNCDATFLAYNTRLIYRETRNIARCCALPFALFLVVVFFFFLCVSVCLLNAWYTRARAMRLHPRSRGHFFKSNFSIPRIFFFLVPFLARQKKKGKKRIQSENGNHPSIREKKKRRRRLRVLTIMPTNEQ